MKNKMLLAVALLMFAVAGLLACKWLQTESEYDRLVFAYEIALEDVDKMAEALKTAEGRRKK